MDWCELNFALQLSAGKNAFRLFVMRNSNNGLCMGAMGGRHVRGNRLSGGGVRLVSCAWIVFPEASRPLSKKQQGYLQLFMQHPLHRPRFGEITGHDGTKYATSCARPQTQCFQAPQTTSGREQGQVRQSARFCHCFRQTVPKCLGRLAQ